MWTGVFVELIDNFRSGKIKDGIYDQIPILIMFPGLTMSVAYFLAKEGLKTVPLWANIGFILFIVGIILIILFHGRASKNILARIGGGLYSFYNLLTGLISDTVSYARLMALGVATFLIGYAINLLGGMVANTPVVGILIALVILIPMHIVNLAINLISAFVHPVRLQYVEFFSKFYENGGRKYQPFQIETNNLFMKEQQ